MDNRYHLGIHELDTQHEEIDAVIKSLSGAAGEGMAWTEIHSILVRLGELLRFHFSVEESVMQIVSYPFILEHQSAHRNILLELEKLKRINPEGIEASIQTMFTIDVIKHDKVFADFVKTHWQSLML